jgi:hypothetical protein
VHEASLSAFGEATISLNDSPTNGKVYNFTFGQSDGGYSPAENSRQGLFLFAADFAAVSLKSVWHSMMSLSRKSDFFHAVTKSFLS